LLFPNWAWRIPFILSLQLACKGIELYNKIDEEGVGDDEGDEALTNLQDAKKNFENALDILNYRYPRYGIIMRCI